jgi:hypothetical protein
MRGSHLEYFVAYGEEREQASNIGGERQLAASAEIRQRIPERSSGDRFGHSCDWRARRQSRVGGLHVTFAVGNSAKLQDKADRPNQAGLP